MKHESLPDGDANSEVVHGARWPASATVWSSVSATDWPYSELSAVRMFRS